MSKSIKTLTVAALVALGAIASGTAYAGCSSYTTASAPSTTVAVDTGSQTTIVRDGS